MMQVRVLSVQRTNQKFDARHAAHTRTYHYYLPLDVLSPGLSGVPIVLYSLLCTHSVSLTTDT